MTAHIPSHTSPAKPTHAVKQAPPAPTQANAPHGLLRRLTSQRWVVALRSFAVFTGLWWLFSAWNDNPLQLPTPLAVFSAIWELAASGEVFEHAGISTWRLLIALAISILLAVPLGFWMGRSPRVNAYIDPLVEMLRPISALPAWCGRGCERSTSSPCLSASPTGSRRRCRGCVR